MDAPNFKKIETDKICLKIDFHIFHLVRGLHRVFCQLAGLQLGNDWLVFDITRAS
jgi:hypothetical protein